MSERKRSKSSSKDRSLERDKNHALSESRHAKKMRRDSSKKKRKHRKEQKRRSSSTSSSSSSGSSSSTSSSSSSRERKRKERKKKKEKRKKKKLKKLEKLQAAMIGPSVSTSVAGPDDNVDIQEKSRTMRPMTKEEWERKQNTIRKVYDPETGRTRLVKGDGEILEEIVSQEKHKEINKQSTRGDGSFYAMKMGIQEK